MPTFNMNDRVLYVYDGYCNSEYAQRRQDKTPGTVQGRRGEFYTVRWDDDPDHAGRIPEFKLKLIEEEETKPMTRELIGVKPEPPQEPHVVFPVKARGTQIIDANHRSLLEVRASIPSGQEGTGFRRKLAQALADLLNVGFDTRSQAETELKAEAKASGPTHRLRKFVRKTPDYAGQSPAWEVEPGHAVIASTREDAIQQWNEWGKVQPTYGRELDTEFFRLWKLDESYTDGPEYVLRVVTDRDGDTWVERVPGVWHLVQTLEDAQREHSRGHEGTPTQETGFGPFKENGVVIPEHRHM